MTLSDPTSGAGYMFGEKLPSSHMTTIANQQPNALDAVGGGSWTQTANIAIDVDDFQFDFDAGGIGEVRVLTGTPFIWRGTLATDVPQIQGRVYQYPMPISTGRESTTEWTYQVSSNIFVQSNVTTDGYVIVPLTKLPMGSTIDEITAWVDGDGGGSSHSGLPAELPQLIVKYKGTGDTTATTAATITDPSAGLAAYESSHPISASSLGLTVSPSIIYWVEINGEASTNALANCLAFTGLDVDCTVTHLQP